MVELVVENVRGTWQIRNDHNDDILRSGSLEEVAAYALDYMRHQSGVGMVHITVREHQADEAERELLGGGGLGDFGF